MRVKIMHQATVHPYLPAILMGVLAAIAGLLGLFLPETRGTRLPDTVRAANARSGYDLAHQFYQTYN